MTSNHAKETGSMKIDDGGAERRIHRRHDFENHGIKVQRADAGRSEGEQLGSIVDISAGGVRIKTNESRLRPDGQVRVRLELPTYAGISAFVDTSEGNARPKKDWTGWLSISRVRNLGDNTYEVGGRLVDMEEMDRGMLSLYLSTQPLAA